MGALYKLTNRARTDYLYMYFLVIKMDFTFLCLFYEVYLDMCSFFYLYICDIDDLTLVF